MKTEPILLFYLLVLSLGSGFSLGLGRDLLLFVGRVLLKLFSKSDTAKKHVHTIIQLVQDLFFCLVVGCVLTVILFYYSEGKIRVFAVMALFLGFFLYCKSIGELFCRFSVRIAEAAARALSRLFACLTLPVFRFFAWLLRCVSKPIRAFNRKIKERHRQKYHAARMKELRKISKEGFVNI